MPQEIMTEKEAAVFVRSSIATLARARKAGKSLFPFVMVGDRAMYSKSAILEAFGIKTPVVTKNSVGRPRKTN